MSDELPRRRKTPRPAMPHSLRHALRQFYDANPKAELSRQQIADKFHRAVKTVDITLAIMRIEGELESVHAWRRPEPQQESQ